MTCAAKDGGGDSAFCFAVTVSLAQRQSARFSRLKAAHLRRPAENHVCNALDQSSVWSGCCGVADGSTPFDLHDFHTAVSLMIAVWRAAQHRTCARMFAFLMILNVVVPAFAQHELRLFELNIQLAWLQV